MDEVNSEQFTELVEVIKKLAETLYQVFIEVCNLIKTFFQILRELFAHTEWDMACKWCGNGSNMRDIRGNCPSCGGPRPRLFLNGVTHETELVRCERR